MTQLHYTFSVEYAEKYGLNEAIMLHNFMYWIKINQANNHNCIEGRYWTYNSAKAFQNLFPFWSQKQIQYLLSKMVDCGILLQGCFNKDKRDRTSWYTLSDDFFSDCILQNREMDDTKSGNDILQNREMYNITDKKQQIKNTNKNNIDTASDFSQSNYSEIPNSSTCKKNLPVQKPKKEEEIEVIPNCIDISKWEEWKNYKKEKKQKLTKSTADKQLKNLQKWHLEGQDPNEIIDNSISNGWAGLFPLKQQKSTFNNQNANTKPTKDYFANDRRHAGKTEDDFLNDFINSQ